jgi:hypothetical protein
MNEFNKYETLFHNYFERFHAEIGSRKTDKIVNTIINSKHTKNLFEQSVKGHFFPTLKDFESFVLSNGLAFAFASSEKVAFASIVMLNLWHETINLKMNLANELNLISTFNSMVNKS